MDRRFAITIGINDYTRQPLHYCVDDAKSISEVLEKRCGFKKEDIFVITSDQAQPTKDISGHLQKSLKEITDQLIPNTDSVFFYFAGHGEYHFEKSGLLFHDSIVEIADIYNQINNLRPKYQCYVIDACESGGKVLTRGQSKVNLVENYIAKSEGVLFMYAATENESAKEFDRIKHGLFTYYFLKAIEETSLYDTDGVLTPNRIQDYIARETSKESQFKQTPVIENRTIGYYPFAFNAPVSQSIAISGSAQTQIRSISSSGIDQTYFPLVPKEIRDTVFQEIRNALVASVEEAKKTLQHDGYEIIFGSDLSIFNDTEVEDKLTDSIVDTARNEKIEAIDPLFSSERRENSVNDLFPSLSILQAFSFRNKPKFTYYNTIYWDEKNINGFSVYLKSKDIYKVSCGLIVAVYQAVYGIGLAHSSFYLDFTGENDTKLVGPYAKVYAYKVHSNTASNVKQSFSNAVTTFKSKIEEWNRNRLNVINTFGNKAR